jgi:hypothetical protein
MTFTTLLPRHKTRRTSLVASLALIVATSFATQGIADTSEETASAPEVIGEMHFDGRSYDLTIAYWCEPEEGFERGTTIAMRMMGYNEATGARVYASHLDRDRDRPSVQHVHISLGPDDHKIGGDIILTGRQADDPGIRIDEDGVVHIKAPFREGDVVAWFTLPEEPGFPSYC